MNTKILSILPLFLTISSIKADYNFFINDPKFNLGSDTLTKQYKPIFKQFSEEESKAYNLFTQKERLLNSAALKIFDNINEQKHKECWQSKWLYQTFWGDDNRYYTDSYSCKQLEDLQAESLKILKTADEWSCLKPLIQDFRAHNVRMNCLGLIFIINDDKKIPQESKKEAILNAINERINNVSECPHSIAYSETITVEAREWIKQSLNPIIESVCKAVN